MLDDGQSFVFHHSVEPRSASGHRQDKRRWMSRAREKKKEEGHPPEQRDVCEPSHADQAAEDGQGQSDGGGAVRCVGDDAGYGCVWVKWRRGGRWRLR